MFQSPKLFIMSVENSLVWLLLGVVAEAAHENAKYKDTDNFLVTVES
jgi:hypothetical protein